VCIYIYIYTEINYTYIIYIHDNPIMWKILKIFYKLKVFCMELTAGISKTTD